MIESAVHDASTPRRLAAQASVTLVIAEYYGAIDSDMDPAAQQTFVRNCQHRLDQLPVLFAKAWDRQLDFGLAACRLQLCATIIVRNLRFSKPLGWSRTLLVQASSHACEALEKFQGLVKKPITNGLPASHTPQARALPKNALRHTLNAVFFLLNFTCYNLDCPEADRQQALQVLNGTVEALKDWSVRPDDEPARSWAALQTKLEHSELWQTQQLQINDRGSASILWDSIRKTRRHRSRAAPKLPDLLELIDPTRSVEDKSGDSSNGARYPASADESVEDFDWDDTILEFFDFGLFDQSSLNEFVPLY
nr:hypothetical protein CFP56_30954 [Quercus suber]